jgi:LacI family transcriptional regulator
MLNKSGRGRANIRDVAKLAEVSPITVSRVINKHGYVSTETRERVERAIDQLNYIPNSLSQSLRYQKTDMVTLMVSDVTNPFWTTVTRGVEDVCLQHGLNVILCNTDEDSGKLARYVHTLMKRQVDGFIIAVTGNDNALIHQIEDNQIPVILVDRTLHGVRSPAVYSDNEGGAYALTQHLIQLGHRHIALISGSVVQSTSIQRINGYRKALAEAGIERQQVIAGRYSQHSGYNVAKQVFSGGAPYPTALIAGNNFIALGALRALEECNLRVPQDVSLVAFDDKQYQIFPKPFLTTAVQDSYRLGQEAAALLIGQMRAEHKLSVPDVVLPIEIILRESTAPPAGES